MWFRWVLTIGDSLVPIGIGILEFTLIASLRLNSLMVWFLILAILFVVMTVTFKSMRRRAHQEVKTILFPYGYPCYQARILPSNHCSDLSGRACCDTGCYW